MNSLRIRLASLLVTCALAGGIPAVAQEGGTLRGVVTDRHGNPMPGSTVTVRSKANPSVNNQGTLCNARGEYRLPLLPAGNDYEVSAAFPGFATVIKRPVNLDAAGTTRVDFILTEEQIERIVVEAKGDIVDTESTSASTAISTEFIAGLPILGHNYSDVLTLAPGVTDTDGDGNPNVKGSREVDFQLRISGVQTNDPFAGGKALDFNLEAIEEIQILTGALTAEHSSQGGVGLVSTRSGGNEFEGSAKVFYQTRALDGDGANNKDITSQGFDAPSFRTLRPFVTAGGAIKKDRLWYFTALEYLDESEPIVFSSVTRNSSREGHRDFAKFTWQVNPEHKASLELYYEPTDTMGNNIGPTIDEDSDVLIDSVGRLFTARETAVFSPTVFLDSTLSLFRTDLTQNPVFEPIYNAKAEEEFYRDINKPEMADFVARHNLDINPTSDHYLFDLDNRTVRGPFFLNQDLDGRQWSLREDLSFYVDDFLGSHTLKSGLEVVQQQHEERSEFRPTVVFEQAREVTLYNLNVPVPAGTVPLEANRLNIGLYVQDTWKPIPNLTINAGLRLDREVVEADGRMPFDPLLEVQEYNRVAREFFDPTKSYPVGNEPGAIGQFVTGSEGSLNFNVNPETETFFCDLDGDGTCNGRTSATSDSDPTVPSNSDTAVLRGIFTRDNFDCSAINGWSARTGLTSASGEDCSSQFVSGTLREGTDLRPDSISLENTNLAPRFSISFDPFADGKTKLYATYGRFYGSLFLGTVVNEKRADVQSLSADKAEKLEYLDHGTDGAFTIYRVSRDLRTPFTTEVTFGLERELAPELAVKMIFTQRKGHDQLQDQDINHVAVDRTGGTNNTSDGKLDDCLSGLDPNPSVCTPDGSADIEPLNPNFNQVFLLGNLNTSEFRSVELVLTKRLHRHWQFETSYTWSEAMGNAEEFLSLLGDDPSQTELEDGFLSFDQRHVLKFNAIAQLPKEIQIGGLIQYESGLPFSIINRDFVSDNLGNTTFRTTFPTQQRNDQRNKSFWTFNTNVKKSFTAGGRVKGTVSFDVFDLLNSDDLRIFSVNRANNAGLQISDPGDPATRQFGRRFQIGVELHF